MARTNLEIDLGGPRKAHIVNPDEFMSGGYGERRSQRYTDLYLFSIGAYGWTKLLVWEPGSLKDALEKAAEWLAENEPGNIMLHDSDELRSLYKEAAEDLGIPWPVPNDDEVLWERIDREATADLTHTEAGYLTSYEWSYTELSTSDPDYVETFKRSFDSQRSDLDEDDRRKARRLLRDLQDNVKRSSPSRAKNLTSVVARGGR